MQTTDMPPNSALSTVLIGLMRGVTYRDADEGLWQSLLQLQARIRDYVSLLGLDLVLDEAEGYAYLRQRPVEEAEERKGENDLPRLVRRIQLSYPVSLLLALLRKKLVEFDARGDQTRCILKKQEMIEMVKVFYADTQNEVKMLNRISVHINKAVDLGFLRRMTSRAEPNGKKKRDEEEAFEVMRILKTFVDAQWLGEFDTRLKEYLNHKEKDVK